MEVGRGRISLLRHLQLRYAPLYAVHVEFERDIERGGSGKRNSKEGWFGEAACILVHLKTSKRDHIFATRGTRLSTFG